MAQTIAAHAGYEARLRGGRPELGFLLGTRDYRADVAEFPLGAELSVAVEPVAVEPRIASFRCAIAMQTTVATAVVTVYRPPPGEWAQPGAAP
jgi:predicted hotdog family 3-hydroxylacyl-ACP dehydratase